MSKQKVDLMVDMETLGTVEGSVILSVGIIVFNRETFSVLEEHYFEPNAIQQIIDGRRIDPSTQDWWIKQDKEELERLLDGVDDLDDVIYTLTSLIRDYKVEKVWSRGCMDFHLVQEITGEVFFHSQHSDVRTLDVFGVPVPKAPHNALEDCEIQLAYVKEVLGRWRGYCAAESAPAK